MKNVGPIRKELAVKPFNMLTDGKSIFPKNQLVGVLIWNWLEFILFISKY
jgi:hypothetical protein